MKICVVVGNPKPASRTLHIATGLGDRTAAAFGERLSDVIDLAVVADTMFTWPNAVLDGVVDTVIASDVVVVASPVYKGTYTGLLKSFFDRFDTDALAGIIAIPVMSVGSPAHSLAADSSLRPLLVELGASVPTASLVFMTSQFEDAETILDEWCRVNIRAVGSHLAPRRRSGDAP